MLSQSLLLLLLPTLTFATNLYVSTYDDTITTLSLTTSNQNSSNFSLQPIATAACSPNPSWLTFDAQDRTLYCIGEGLTTTNGSLTTFSALENGTLVKTSEQDTISGGVSGVIYNIDGQEKGLALAHYGGSALSTYLLQCPTKNSTFPPSPPPPPQPLQYLPFTLPSPGPNAARQAAPHPHQVVLDPTAKYIISPDLGADLVRVFSIENGTGLLVTEEALKVKPGSGPRHVVFWRSWVKGKGDGYEGECVEDGEGERFMLQQGMLGNQQQQQQEEDSKLFMFVVTELTNTVTSYAVTYPLTGGMSFEQVWESNTFGSQPIPEGAAAAEIAIVGDYMIISNRNDSSFSKSALPCNSSTMTNTNTTATAPTTATNTSDSLAVFSLFANGSFGFLQLYPASGLFPRHFSVNKAGDLVAVGLQRSGKVVVFKRDVLSGKFVVQGGMIAEMSVGGKGTAPGQGVDGGEVTCVVWDEGV